MVKIPESLESILERNPNYVVYILKCKDPPNYKSPGYYYVGYTNDFKRRLKQHESGRGAEFTRFYGVDKVIHIEPYDTKEEAMKKETMFTLYTISKLYSIYASQSIDHVGGGKYPGVIKSLSERIEILKALKNYMEIKEEEAIIN